MKLLIRFGMFRCNHSAQPSRGVLIHLETLAGLERRPVMTRLRGVRSAAQDV